MLAPGAADVRGRGAGFRCAPDGVEEEEENKKIKTVRAVYLELREPRSKIIPIDPALCCFWNY